MTFTAPEVAFKKLKRGDKDFHMTNGITVMPRAQIEFSETCPMDLINQVSLAVSKGWIRPVAYIKESEYVWEVLEK